MKIVLHCRGVHNDSIFRLTTPSHVLMSQLLSESISTYKRHVTEQYECDASTLDHRDFQRCLELLESIQDVIAKELSRLFERYEREAERLGFTARTAKFCADPDHCRFEFFLIASRDNLIAEILRAHVNISIIYDPDYDSPERALMLSDPIIKTAIYVPDPSTPAPLDLADKIVEHLKFSEIPYDLEREDVEVIDLDQDS